MIAQYATAIRNFFDRAAATWDLHSGGQFEKLKHTLEAAHFPKHAKVLDVACGTGVLMEPILEFQPVQIRAIDLSPAMIDMLHCKYGHIHIIKATASDFYTFSETEFDVITIYNAYPHFLDKQLLAQKLYQCLRPGGRFIIAHGDNRLTVNTRHSGNDAPHISMPLLSCEDEALRMGDTFSFDIMLDEQNRYILSGIRE